MILGILKIILSLKDRHVFMWQLGENFERVQYLHFETDFLENKNLFQKTVAFFSWKC